MFGNVIGIQKSIHDIKTMNSMTISSWWQIIDTKNYLHEHFHTRSSSDSNCITPQIINFFYELYESATNSFEGMNAWLCSDNRGESGDHLAVRTFKFGPLLSTSFKILYTKIVLRYSHFPINICNTPCKSLQDQPNQNMYLRRHSWEAPRPRGIAQLALISLSPACLSPSRGWSLIHLFKAFWRLLQLLPFSFTHTWHWHLSQYKRKSEYTKNTHLRATCWRDEHVITPKSKIALLLVPRRYS